MLLLVRAGSGEEAQALGRSTATPEDLADAAPLTPILGAARLYRRRLLRACAAKALAVPAGAIRIERLDTGGQRIIAPAPLFASVAARGDWVAIALSVSPIGVDIETRHAEQPLPIDLLHPRERDVLRHLSPENRAQTFLRFWTAREAYLKALGAGLPNDLAQIEARDEPDGAGVLLVEADVVRAKAAITLTEEYVLAVVELGAAE